MSNEKELRDAKRQRRADEGRVAMADYKRQQFAVQERTKRLRALRLAQATKQPNEHP